MTEQTDAAGINIAQPALDQIEVPLADIPERYVERLERAAQTDVAALLLAMGVEKSEDKVTLKLADVKKNLEEHGVESNFGFAAVPEGVVTHQKYLELTAQGLAPLGTRGPDTMLHDTVFHGVGFVGLDTPLADLIKSASKHALATQNQKTISDCALSIDALTGSYFGSFIQDDTDLAADLAEQVIPLGDVLGTTLPGQSMTESMNQQRNGQNTARQARDLAVAGAAHFNTLLNGLNQPQATQNTSIP